MVWIILFYLFYFISIFDLFLNSVYAVVRFVLWIYLFSFFDFHHPRLQYGKNKNKR